MVSTINMSAWVPSSRPIVRSWNQRRILTIDINNLGFVKLFCLFRRFSAHVSNVWSLLFLCTVRTLGVLECCVCDTMENCLFDLASLKVNMNSRMVLFAFRARYCKEFFLCSVSSNVITCFASEMAFLFVFFKPFVIETTFHNLINQWTISMSVIHHFMDVKWVMNTLLV